MPTGPLLPALDPVVERIMAVRHSTPVSRAVLVAVSGIDGAGKGHVAERLAAGLRVRGLTVADLCIDGWLRLPAERFAETDPAGHFYRHAIRFDEMFDRLVLPLRDRRSVRVEVDFAEETAITYRRHRYAYDDVDVVLLEGIYLLKRELSAHYDLSLWIECGFETALERAIARAQEGLSPAETTAAYRRIYFPAQAIHFERDAPRDTATLVVENDPRMTRPA